MGAPPPPCRSRATGRPAVSARLRSRSDSHFSLVICDHCDINPSGVNLTRRGYVPMARLVEDYTGRIPGPSGGGTVVRHTALPLGGGVFGSLGAPTEALV